MNDYIFTLNFITFLMESQIQPVRARVDRLESYFKSINEEITANLKLFDDIKMENKQAYESIHRNLDDLKLIYEGDLNKYEQTVDKQIGYSEALFQRV